MRWLPLQVAAAALAVETIGCSNTPSRVQLPAINVEQAGLAAIQEYEDDGNGSLSRAELTKVPGILRAIGHYDTNQDNSVSADEISQRLTQLRATKIGMEPIFCKVTLDGRPLEGAVVKFIPESFFGSDIKSATGVATPRGLVNMEIDTSELPKDQRMLKGAHCGIYKIEVAHPTHTISARYNVNTVLGVEVAPLREIQIDLDLQSS